MLYKLFLILKKFWAEGQINRLILMASAAIILIVAAFGGYYYWDRYVFLGDRSPLELGVEHLEQAVRENPEDPQARLALAQYYYDNGAYSDAAAQSRQVLSAFPENDGALFVLGMSLIRTGKGEESVAYLEEFVAIRRESPMSGSDIVLESALYFLGETYNQLDRSQDAIAVLSEALTINRTDADAMYQLGLGYAQTAQHELAIEQYQNAVRFVPTFAEAYREMYVSYAALDRPAYAAYARGMEAFSLQEYETARTHLENAAQTLPDFAPVYLGLGLVYEQAGELESAVASLERALELDPGNFMARNTLERIQLSIDAEGTS